MSIKCNKSFISSETDWDKISYPVHGIRKETLTDKPYTVLFIAKGNGLVVKSSNKKHPVGEAGTFWGMRQFIVAPIGTETTIIND